MRYRRSLVALALPAVLLGTLLAMPGVASADGTVDTIAVGDEPRNIAFSSDGAFAYVPNRGDDTVSKIDADTRTVVGTVTVGDEPTGIAMTPSGTQLWVGNFNAATISIIDVASFTVVDTINSGGNGPYGIVFNAAGTLAYVTNYFIGNVTAINTSTKTVVDTASYSSFYPEGISLNADGSALYFASTSQNRVYKLATATLDEITSIAVGTFPIDVELSPDGTQLWVTNNDNVAPSVSVISTATDTVLDTIPTSEYPIGVEWGWDGNVWVVHSSVSAGPDKFDYATRTPLLSDLPIGGYAFGLAARPGSKELYATVSSEDEVQVLGVETGRTSGADRYQVSINVSQEAFPSGAPVVYIATGANYPDALSAGPVASAAGGPVLLTPGDALPAAVLTEISRLGATSAVIVGGPASVSPHIKDQLETLLGDGNVTRLGGADRYEASRTIISSQFSGPVAQLYITTGRNFPDALSAGAAGATTGTPVLLVDGLATSLDSATLSFIASLNPGEILIAGGPASVSPQIMTQLEGLYTVTRLSGADRYQASIAINNEAFDTASTAFIATGLKFPDALSGSSWAGVLSAPLYVTPATCVPAGLLAELDRMQVGHVQLLGGPASLTVAVEDLTRC